MYYQQQVTVSSPQVEKQHRTPTGEQSTVLLRTNRDSLLRVRSKQLVIQCACACVWLRDCSPKGKGCLRFIRRFCTKRLNVILANNHTLMVVAAMQGANQHIRSSFMVQYLAQRHFDIRPGQLNKTLVLPLSRRRRPCHLMAM